MREIGADTHKIEVRTCRHGLGVFARYNIPAGAEILRLQGDMITFREAALRGEAQCYAMQVGPDSYLDLTAPGRLVNHSCEPNSGILLGVALCALRTIQAGEEVFYDYSTTMDENYWTMTCSCQSDACRGVIRDFRTLPAARQQHYLLLQIVQPFIVARGWSFLGPVGAPGDARTVNLAK